MIHIVKLYIPIFQIQWFVIHCLFSHWVLKYTRHHVFLPMMVHKIIAKNYVFMYFIPNECVGRISEHYSCIICSDILYCLQYTLIRVDKRKLFMSIRTVSSVRMGKEQPTAFWQHISGHSQPLGVYALFSSHHGNEILCTILISFPLKNIRISL